MVPLRAKTAILLLSLLCASAAAAQPPAPAVNSNAGSPIVSNHREEIVHFRNRGAVLEATLYLPNRPGKVPGIVLVHGAGPNPRAAFQLVATQLVKAGYAVLNYDKRGVGGSTGEFDAECWNCRGPIALLASDASAALTFLATRREVDKARLGYWGVSQAGWIVPQAALMNRRASFMLMVSAPATTVHFIAKIGELAKGQPPGLPPEQADAQARQSTITFDFPDTDPLPDLRKLHIPGLWLMGDQDGTVPAGSTIAVIQQLADEGKPYQHRLIKGGGHLMAWIQPDGYWQAAEQWLRQVTGRRR